MYLVKVRIGRSAIQGVGVFADEDIAAGTTVSQFVPGFDQTFDPSILETDQFPPVVREFVEHHTYLNDGRLWMPGDLDIYTNHSFTPSVGYRDEDGSFYALRAIKKGEEITNDYRQFSEYSRTHAHELS